MPVATIPYTFPTTLTTFTAGAGGSNGNFSVTYAGASNFSYVYNTYPAFQRTGRNVVNGSPFFDVTTTLTALGIPGNATVTDIGVSIDYMMTGSTVAASQFGAAQLYLNDGTTQVGSNFFDAVTVSTTSSVFTNKSGTITNMQVNPAVTLRFRFTIIPKTGASNSANCTLNFNNLNFIITYTVPAPVTPVAAAVDNKFFMLL